MRRRRSNVSDNGGFAVPQNFWVQLLKCADRVIGLSYLRIRGRSKENDDYKTPSSSHGDTLRRRGFTIPACAVRNIVISENTEGRLTPDEIHRRSIRLEQHR
jgi:hypothetical protein